jgi:asparagine synthase (glutamine-hydrolysing)
MLAGLGMAAPAASQSAQSLKGPGLEIVMTGRSGEQATFEGEGLRIACHGAARVARLGADADPDNALRAVARSYRERGVGALAELRGAFAVAIVDPGRREVILAADRMGITPLFFRADEGGLAFGTSPGSVVTPAGRAAAISRQALFDFLYFHMVPGQHSIF